MPRNPHKTTCAWEGCRAYARRGTRWCVAHLRRGEADESVLPGPDEQHNGTPLHVRSGQGHAGGSSFYEPSLSDEERRGFPEALRVEGLDQEIAVLRVRLRSVMEEYPERFDLQLQTVRLLVKAVAVKYRLSQKSEDDLYQNMLGVLRGIGGVIWPEAFDGV